MNREEAEKKANEQFEIFRDVKFGDNFLGPRPEPSYHEVYIEAYLQAFDDFKAEFTKVPWTEEEAQKEISEIRDGYESHAAAIGAKEFKFWAEKKINGRG